MSRRAVVVGEKGAGFLLARTLSDRGYTTTSLSNGRLVPTWAREHQPDLIFLAGPTVELSSTELCRSLKLQRSTSLLSVVVVREPTAPGALTVQVEPDAELDPALRELSHALERALAVRREQQRDGILAEVRFRLPSENDQLEVLLSLLGPWFGSCGLGPYQAQQLNMAVREVAANAIEWGHRGQRDRLVSVAARLDAEKVSVDVSDTGPGFDRRNLPHAARPGDPLSHLEARAERNLRDGGFGILMASGLVDHLCYNDAGNEAQLLKFLPARARPALPPLDSQPARWQP